MVRPQVVQIDPTQEPHPTHHSPLFEVVRPQVVEIDPTQEPHPAHHSPLSEVVRPQVVEIDATQEPHPIQHSPLSEVICPKVVEIDATQEAHPNIHSPLSEVVCPQVVEIDTTQERRHRQEDYDDLTSGRPRSAGDREVDGHEPLEWQQHDHPRRARTVPEDAKNLRVIQEKKPMGYTLE